MDEIMMDRTSWKDLKENIDKYLKENGFVEDEVKIGIIDLSHPGKDHEFSIDVENGNLWVT